MKKYLNVELMERTVGIVFLLLVVVSCQDIVIEKLDLKQLQSERLSEIDWGSLDVLPTPPGCNEVEDSKVLSPCFLDFMRRSLAEDQQLIGKIRDKYGDTLQLNLVVDVDGVVQVGYALNQHKTNLRTSEKDSLHDKILSDLEDLIAKEPWTPGVKRGVPVRVAFDYDLVLRDQK